MRLMNRNALVVAALLAAGCSATTDPRPATLAYIAEAILVPNCGRAACHASGASAASYTFDTVASSKAALQRLVQPGNADASQLLQAMGESPRTGRKRGIMPPDGALPTADLELIRTWIDDGAVGLR